MIGNKFYERDVREIGWTLVRRACDIVKRSQMKKSVTDRNQHPMNVIIGSPGAGKTTLQCKLTGTKLPTQKLKTKIPFLFLVCS